MRVLMVAPPGAGKGTQGAVIASHFDIPHIATGDLLREHVAKQTELGRAVRHHLDRGDLVPDEIVLDMVREAFVQAKENGGGYVLDGMPRNIEQARALYQTALTMDMTANVALHLKADDDELIRRLLARAALEHRTDDTEPVIRPPTGRLSRGHAPDRGLVRGARHPGLGGRHAPGRAGRPADPDRARRDGAAAGPRAGVGPAADRPDRPERRVRVEGLTCRRYPARRRPG